MFGFNQPLQLAAWLCLSAHWTSAQRVLRNPSAARDSYDYIIAGGGLTGLVVANRLTEDPKTTVLVVEYGDLADSWNLSIPYYATALQDASLMFATPSVPQRGLGGRTFNLPLGATVGGGSTVNGMAYLRGAKVDYDTWERIGNRGWGWKEMFKYFKKSSTLNVPSPELVKQLKLNYTYVKSSFGHGPAQATLPPWQWPDVYYLYKAWTDDMGYPLLNDSMSGNILGAAWRGLSSDGKNQTRCSARKAYYDPVQHRPNLQLLVNSYVGKVQIQKSVAKGVEVFSRNGTSTKVSISAKKEVILAAGGIHTPQILQLSGIGPRDLLERLNIPVVEDLPGVGANFMDHPTLRGASFRFNSPNPLNFALLRNNATFFNAAWEEYMANRTGPLTAANGNSGLIATLHNLTSDTSNLIHTLVTSVSSTSHLPAHYHDKPTLLAGYAAQVSLLTNALLAGTNPLTEFGWSGGTPGMGIVLQKPLSRGTVLINSTNPHPGLSPPLVDFNAFTHPFDAQTVILAFRLLRKVLLTSHSLQPLGVEELVPGSAVQTDAEIEAALRGSLMSPHNAHPCGTAGMMPRELGGVVGDKLRVYGMKGLRVVDASILPVIVAANLQATMYAVAEKAADIIKGAGGRE